MDIRKELNDSITEMEKKFAQLVNEKSLSINDIEDLSLNSTKQCEHLINNYLCKLVKKNINEKELIIKKNKNGKKKDTN